MEAHDKYQKAKRSLIIAEKLSLSKIPYKEWTGEEVTGCDEPLYYSQIRLTNLKNISSLSSSGFINIIRRRMNLGVPTFVYKDKDVSGTVYSYLNHFKLSAKKRVSKLTVGDLLIWKPTGSSNGHMAIYFEKPVRDEKVTEGSEKERKEKKIGYVWHCVPFAGIIMTPLSNVIETKKTKFITVSRDVWLYN